MVSKMKIDKADHYDDIDNIYQLIWKLLEFGKKNSNSDMHQGYLATHSARYPSIRTVVLRGVDKVKQTISFHTDFRSEKIKEINKNNKISLLFYDHDQKVQIKCSGIGLINNQNDNADQAWQRTQSFSKKCYIVDKAPGSTSDKPTSGYKKEHEIELPNEEILNSGYENFTLVSMEVSEIEWLYLHRHGHRRAKFIINNKDLVKKVWLTP